MPEANSEMGSESFDERRGDLGIGRRTVTEKEKKCFTSHNAKEEEGFSLLTCYSYALCYSW